MFLFPVGAIFCFSSVGKRFFVSTKGRSRIYFWFVHNIMISMNTFNFFCCFFLSNEAWIFDFPLSLQSFLCFLSQTTPRTFQSPARLASVQSKCYYRRFSSCGTQRFVSAVGGVFFYLSEPLPTQASDASLNLCYCFC